MSLLETPRIAFGGRISWDPITTNNQNKFYDEDNCETVLRPGESASAFRETAVAAVTQGNWNPHGTHRSVFHETTITSVDRGQGPSEHDAFVGQPVAFAGKLVDCEPYGADSSQLFFDRMSFGIDGGCRVLGPRVTRMHARGINFGRNLGYAYTAGGASVSWQTGFSKHAGLAIDAHDSEALQALARALEDDDVLGLLVRWNAYTTEYYDQPNLVNGSKTDQQVQAELQAKIASGGFQPNPARGKIVGVLGLWRVGEPMAVGGDRFLVSNAKRTARNYFVGSGYARLGCDHVTLDLQNSICETDFAGHKEDLGPLAIVARDPSGVEKDDLLATVAYDSYDQAAYELAGGLVSAKVDPELAKRAAGRDLILQGADGTQYLVESPLYACPESPNTYLDQGESSTVQVRILERGKPPKAAVELQVSPVAGGTSTIIQSDAEGIARVPVSGTTPDVVGFMLTAGAGTLPKYNPMLTPYQYVRTYPSDSGIAEMEATWSNVYAKVLINWHALAPCMDNWLNLGNPAEVAAHADVLRRITAKSNFESYGFMPVTRDLTPGMRTLLLRWLDAMSGRAEGVKLTDVAAVPPRPRERIDSFDRRGD